MNFHKNLKKISLISICFSVFLIQLLSFSLIVDINSPISKEENQISIIEILTPRTAWHNNSEAPIFIDATATGIDAKNWTWARNQSWCSQGDGSWGDPYVIENVSINEEKGTDDGIEIRNSNDVYFKINNCTLFNGSEGGPEAGIHLYNTSKGLLIKNNCSFNYYGINLEGSSNNTIKGNFAHNNTLYGIRLTNISATVFTSYNNSLLDNTCYFNQLLGINVASGNETIISGNFCYNNSNTGMALGGYSFRSKIFGNKCTNNTNNGILIAESSDNTTVKNNNCTNNNKGISISLTSLVTLEGNNCSFNTYGMSLLGSKNTTIKGNIVNHNFYYGISLSEDSGLYSDNGIISGNDCNYNGNYGIMIDKSSNTNVSGNDCIHNNHGILIQQDSLNTKVLSNTCSFNQEGIYVTLDSHNTEVIGNTCLHNTRNGMTATDGNNFTIIGNTMSYNGETIVAYCGLNLQNSNNTNINGNTFNYNLYAGIRVKGNDNNLTSNTCNNNINGIMVEGNNNNISVNTCNNNTGIAINILGGVGNKVNFNMMIDNLACIVDSGTGTIINGNTCGTPTPTTTTTTPPAPLIPGYDIYILIGAISLIITVLMKRRHKRIL